VELPRASRAIATTSGEDVLVFITCDNLDEFFREDWQDLTRNKLMKDVKNLIQYGISITISVKYY
jgi:DNA-binding ferritin-like protein (Dps family)